MGKSTTASNLSVAFTKMGLKVMQIGCDPKADSTSYLHGGEPVETVLDLIRKKGKNVPLEDLVTEGTSGVLCVEAGGPTPGMGCAGRGIIAALETLEEKEAFEIYEPDVILYDVLGDVVCGGFAMPIREGYAEKVFLLTSGENMAIHAAANIAMAVKNSRTGVCVLGRNYSEQPQCAEGEGESRRAGLGYWRGIVGQLPFSREVQQAEERRQTVIEAFPDGEMAGSIYVWQNRYCEFAGRRQYEWIAEIGRRRPSGADVRTGGAARRRSHRTGSQCSHR